MVKIEERELFTSIDMTNMYQNGFIDGFNKAVENIMHNGMMKEE